MWFCHCPVCWKMRLRHACCHSTGSTETWTRRLHMVQFLLLTAGAASTCCLRRSQTPLFLRLVPRARLPSEASVLSAAWSSSGMDLSLPRVIQPEKMQKLHSSAQGLARSRRCTCCDGCESCDGGSLPSSHESTNAWAGRPSRCPGRGGLVKAVGTVSGQFWLCDTWDA